MEVKIVAVTLVVAKLSVGVALAQSPSAHRYHPSRPIHSPPVVMHHASTAQEGFFRGLADLRRAIGEFNYNTSLALINREEAIRLRLVNQKQYANDFFEKRAINRAAREEERRTPPTQEDLARYAKKRLPERLASYEYHRISGRLTWPAVFQRAEYDAVRHAIDQAVAERTVDNSGVGSANYERIKNLTAAMNAKLRSEVDELSTSESIRARKFLQSLAYEARFPLSVDVGDLASVD
jgi:hypothetical protein